MKPIQWKAATILAGGETQVKTAADCGVCAFRRWLKRPEFQDAIQKEIPKVLAATRTVMPPLPPIPIALIDRTKPHTIFQRAHSRA